MAALRQRSRGKPQAAQRSAVCLSHFNRDLERRYTLHTHTQAQTCCFCLCNKLKAIIFHLEPAEQQQLKVRPLRHSALILCKVYTHTQTHTGRQTHTRTEAQAERAANSGSKSDKAPQRHWQRRRVADIVFNSLRLRRRAVRLPPPPPLATARPHCCSRYAQKQ